MCILFIYRNRNAGPESYRIILAANRDEVFERPTLPAHYWEDHSECLGGTDMEPGKEGGTWLAVSVSGKAGAILNLSNETGLPNSPKRGRGSLITDYITANESADSYLSKLHKENQNGQPYNPYNLVLVNLYNANVHYLSSSNKSTGPYLCRGNVLGFGNSELEVPYRKVEGGTEKFKDITQNARTSKQRSLIEDLIKFLKSEERYLPDPELQRRCPQNFEELSSIFVTFAEYGTRTHSILLVDSFNKMTFVEETLMPDLTWKQQLFEGNLPDRNKE